MALLEIPLEQIEESFAGLRLSSPAAEEKLLTSVRDYGQISPVSVFGIASRRYEMVDGFKRLRVCRKLEFKTLQATLLKPKEKFLKAAMIIMNWKVRTITDLEEGMIIASLCEKEKLTQTAIATMLGRHKSWVSRRIKLVRYLCEEAWEHIRLGLISPTMGRELSKLPRGNQEQLLKAILQHQLTTRQTAKLALKLQREPQRNHAAILENLTPDDLVDSGIGRSPKRGLSSSHRSSESESPLDKLLSIEQLLLGWLNAPDFPKFVAQNPPAQQQIHLGITRIAQLLEQLQSLFHSSVALQKSTDSTDTSPLDETCNLLETVKN